MATADLGALSKKTINELKEICRDQGGVSPASATGREVLQTCHQASLPPLPGDDR